MFDLTSAIEAGVRAVYQPIVHLDSAEVVGYEALSRGPQGSPLESPAALFAAARDEGRVAELDWACRKAALQGALTHGLRPPAALFVNVEPDVLGLPPDAETADVLRRADQRLSVFVEVTERALTLRPAELLAAVEDLRERGWGIALDDVGADPRSLALLPLLRPDVVKLDMSLVHAHPSRASGEVLNGVCAYAEQTGAVILAEGVEDEGHVVAARSLGATLAQGWHFGRPAELPHDATEAVSRAVTLGVPARRAPDSPVDLVRDRRPLRVGRKDVLLSITRALEAQALALGGHAVVLSAFQDVRHFSPATADRYARLARETAFAAALGAGMPEEPAPGVRGAELADGDVLRGEWDIAVIGPHYAGALVARDLGDDGEDRMRRFEFVLTFDRELVLDVAASLMLRVRGVRDLPVLAAA